jgi:DnaJ-class molecular chaperone
VNGWMCGFCGGTGSAFDGQRGEWVTPSEPCPDCHGTGEQEFPQTSPAAGADPDGDWARSPWNPHNQVGTP